MKTITLCMIVKNEEDVLARCLSSAKEQVDEIVIIDTGSTDSTVEIARGFTDKIYFFEWIDDFAAARNESIKYATSDYILIMDADEYLDDQANLRADLMDNYDYYYTSIKNETSLGQNFIHTGLRIFKNKIGFEFENRLHENINLTERASELVYGRMKSIIHHTGYTDLKMVEKDKYNRNKRLMSIEVEANPSPYNLFNMGKTYFLVSEYDKAVEFFKRAYPLSLNRVYLPELLTKLAQSLLEIGHKDEALSVLKGAAVLFPNETAIHFNQGIIYCKLNYFKDAEQCFLKCLLLGDQGTTLEEGIGGYRSRLELADLYAETGNSNQAYKEILEVMRSNSLFALSKYLKLAMKMDISFDEVNLVIESNYKISNISELQILLEILYRVRHPLFHHYLRKYNVDPQKHVLFVAELYNKDYEEARNLLYSMDDINSEVAKDVLLFSYILKDMTLLNNIQVHLNLGKSEMKIIKQLLKNEKIVGHLNTNVEKIIFNLLERLIVLKEFEIFQTLCEQLISGDSGYRIKIGQLFNDYGFDELAIDMLSSLYNTESNNITLFRLLGDLCFRNKYLEDAKLFYLKLLQIDPSYSAYERVYNLYETLNDTDNALLIKQEIATKFPIVEWAKDDNQ
ncbi:hypothetical protein J41TS12_00640 [Paenibacillus antibioticophila]|uniref:Glycosyltransferase 2-like domain-containing protein n=1 Tax=Paenibacillus antibioticophila TaxID=1274374 RepID=A0A920CEU7_9BACL|nr:glycosyltransferase family 2 protein [Paenibacillus antibioticophila]GIO35203.1 hypothetical protein J41TS12_00640 [Paenibacillus antibioticophila]